MFWSELDRQQPNKAHSLLDFALFAIPDSFQGNLATVQGDGLMPAREYYKLRHGHATPKPVRQSRIDMILYWRLHSRPHIQTPQCDSKWENNVQAFGIWTCSRMQQSCDDLWHLWGIILGAVLLEAHACCCVISQVRRFMQLRVVFSLDLCGHICQARPDTEHVTVVWVLAIRSSESLQASPCDLGTAGMSGLRHYWCTRGQGWIVSRET